MKEIFLEAQALEDALNALDGGYYDTHDVVAFGDTEGGRRARLAELRKMFMMSPGEWFCNYEWDDFNGPVKKYGGQFDKFFN